MDVKHTRPIVQVFPKHMWLSCFPMSHWASQVTWESPDPVCEETAEVHETGHGSLRVPKDRGRSLLYIGKWVKILRNSAI